MSSCDSLSIPFRILGPYSLLVTLLLTICVLIKSIFFFGSNTDHYSQNNIKGMLEVLVVSQYEKYSSIVCWESKEAKFHLYSRANLA